MSSYTSQGASAPLFPLPTVLPPTRPQGSSYRGRVKKYYRVAVRATQFLNHLITTLNCLFLSSSIYSLSSSSNVCVRLHDLSAGHHRVCHYLYDTVKCFARSYSQVRTGVSGSGATIECPPLPHDIIVCLLSIFDSVSLPSVFSRC